MGFRAQQEAPASDAEVFFASVHGATLVLVLHQLVLELLLRSADGALGPSLLARAAPLVSVRLLFTFFVLLPSFLAFAAIGVPFFLRTLSAAVRGRLSRGPLIGLFLLAVCAVGVALEVYFGRNGLISVALSSLIALRFGVRPVASIGRAHGFRLLAAAGVSLAALAWYESRVVEGGEAGIALAPTAMVAAVSFGAGGLLTTTIGALRSGDGRLRIVLAWIVTLGWIGLPLLRGYAGPNAAVADRVELAGVAAAALVLTLLALVRRRA